MPFPHEAILGFRFRHLPFEAPVSCRILQNHWLTASPPLFFQVKEISSVARATAADGNTAAALAGDTAANGQNTAGTATNTIINSNRVFVNNFAAIADLAC